jgi:hypothetical protein
VQDEPLVPAAHDAAVGSKTNRNGRTTRAWPLGWLLHLFAFAMIAPLLGFGILAISRIIVAERAAEEEQLRRAAFMLSAVVDRELTGLKETLRALARSGKLKDGDFAGFHRDASAVVHGMGQAIVLIDRALNQQINTRVPYGTPLPQTGDPDTARKVFATGKPANGDLFVGQLLHQLRISVMVPVMIDGAVHYALVMSIEPATLSRMLEQQYVPDGWVVRVSDRNDRILAATPGTIGQTRRHEYQQYSLGRVHDERPCGQPDLDRGCWV